MVLCFLKDLQTALPCESTIQKVPCPQGEGSHGLGLGTHLCIWYLQISSPGQSESLKHSGPQPEIESGMGKRPGLHLYVSYTSHQ